MQDEKLCLCIRSFHSSILLVEPLPHCGTLYIPHLDLAEPKRHKEQVWATNSNRCAERKAGVDAMRAYRE
jgi:hypothetical protein